MEIKSYRDLIVWRKSMDLAGQVYELTGGFPKHELYGLAAQMRRAAVSIASNVAEGHARESTKEYLHHLSFAVGSVAELETQILLSVKLRYLTQEQITRALGLADEVTRMLKAIRDKLRDKLS